MLIIIEWQNFVLPSNQLVQHDGMMMKLYGGAAKCNVELEIRKRKKAYYLYETTEVKLVDTKKSKNIG